MTPTRPALRWHGGKWRLAPWIVQHFPPHRVYVEPFGGAASVLLRKSRSYAEIWNDLDAEAVNLFKVLREPSSAAELIEQLALTPFARLELEGAYELTEEPIERARRLVVLSFMGFGSNAHARRSTGFRAASKRSGTTPAHDWAHYPDCLRAVAERFRGVAIEQRDGIAVMAAHDAPDTLHYVDPPYIHSTRNPANGPGAADYRGYHHEMTDADHELLLAEVLRLAGAVAISGYAHPLYEAALAGWRRLERATHADGARPRTEILWLNPQACAGLEARLL